MTEIQVGSSVIIGSGTRRGVVKFIGQTEFAEGEWFGVELDKPEGKNSGDVQGRTYFTCARNHGLFVRRAQLKVVDDITDRRSSLPFKQSPQASATTRRSSSILPGSKPAIESSRTSSIPRAPSTSPTKAVDKNQEKELLARISSLEQELEKKNDEIQALQQDTSATDALEGQLQELQVDCQRQMDELAQECEDRIAQLEREHADQVAQLESTNTTHLTQVENLRTELSQKNARLVQFTESEQKRGEEMATAIAKVSTSARKVETLEAKIKDLEEAMELLNLEKETLGMDKEIADERVEECQNEIEALKASLSMATQAAERSEGVSDDISELQEENKKLRQAVRTLHERTIEEKSELTKKVRQLQREESELETLRGQVDQYASQQAKLEAEVEDLKELLDLANAYESMVEDLTEKNLTLGDKVADQSVTIASLESLKEMGEEMEHHHAEYEKELQAEVDSQRLTIQSLKQQISDLRININDRDRTIARFRDLTQKQREDIHSLQTQLHVESGEMESLKDTTHVALNETMGLRALAAQSKVLEMEAAKNKVEMEQARLEASFLRSIVPRSILTDADQRALRVRLRLHRIVGKADILIVHLQKEVEKKEEDGRGALDHRKVVQHLSLADNLSSVACDVRKELCLIESGFLEQDEVDATSSRLDTSQTEQLEVRIDHAVGSCGDGTMFAAQNVDLSIGGRLATAIEEFQMRLKDRSDLDQMHVPAIVKLDMRRHAQSLSFHCSLISSAAQSCKTLFHASDTDNDTPSDQMTIDTQLADCASLVSISSRLHHRLEVDLAPSEEDRTQVEPTGGSVLSTMEASSASARALFNDMQQALPTDQDTDLTQLFAYLEDTCASALRALNTDVAGLYKAASRGAFTDAVAPPGGSEDMNHRQHWERRAQELHDHLSLAASMETTLKETEDVVRTLRQRLRESERSESQSRVVTQKLESEVLALSEDLNKIREEKTIVQSQFAKEQAQWNIALEDLQKEKVHAESLNRELRKQLQRSADTSTASHMTSSRSKPVLKSQDAEAYQKALRHLQSELYQVRSQLVSERMKGVFNGRKVHQEDGSMHEIARDVRTFAREVNAEVAMPRLIDLTDASTSPREQVHKKLLLNAKYEHRLETLRQRLGQTAADRGWEVNAVHAIRQGEEIFASKVKRSTHEQVLEGKMTLGREDVDASPVPVTLDYDDWKQLSQLLVQ